jgi:Coenzyme PQQ synthesis protein D (PqqD)
MLEIGAGGEEGGGSTHPAPFNEHRTRRWRRRADVLERSLPAGVLLLPADGAGVTLLAGTGGELWRLLAEPRNADELTDALACRYAGDARTIRADIGATLADLERGGFVEGEP